MATLLNADLPSDDEEDADFDPDKGPAGGGGAGKGSKSGKGAKRGFMEFSDGGNDDDDDDDGGGDEAVAAGVCSIIAAGLADAMDDTRYFAAAGLEEHDAMPAVDRASPKQSKPSKKAQRVESEALAAVRTAKQTAKVDAIWAALKQGRAGHHGSAPAQPSTSEAAAATDGAAGAGQPAQPAPSAAREGGKAELAAVQTGAPAKRPFSLATVCRPVKKPDKKGDDTAWMAALGMSKKAPSAATSIAGGSSASEAAKAAAQAALAAAKTAASVRAAHEHGSVTVTETRRFAGKDVQMQRTMAASDAKKAAQKQAATGLDAMLEAMNGAKKVNVLDKSRADWGEVKKDSQVEAELEEYKKSGDKYLDRVDFLKRAELRQYEKERDERLGADIRTRGRL